VNVNPQPLFCSSPMSPGRTIILIGMKSSGKTTTGRILARKLGLRFTDMDAEVERLHWERKGERLRFRDIFKQHGKDYFRTLETAALQNLATAQEERPYVLATGGGLPLAEENRVLLGRLGTVVFLDVVQEVLLPRIVRRGIPAFFPYPDDPARSLAELLEARRPIYRALAQISVSCRWESPDAIADIIAQQLEKRACES
jgi:shikimate kinase